MPLDRDTFEKNTRKYVTLKNESRLKWRGLIKIQKYIIMDGLNEELSFNI